MLFINNQNLIIAKVSKKNFTLWNEISAISKKSVLYINTKTLNKEAISQADLG